MTPIMREPTPAALNRPFSEHWGQRGSYVSDLNGFAVSQATPRP